MTGRGRGRGALARWEASKSVGENTTRVGSPISTTVFPLSPKESWEDEIKKIQEDTTRDDRIVRVTHIIDVENFWAQMGSLDELKQFDTYMTALNSWCNEQEHSGVHQAPVHGQSVCVRHTETSQWRRAQIARLSNNVVDVIYLDYGQSECVPLNRLCSSTPGDVMSRRPMAQYVNLEGIHPVGEHWSPQANKRFRELVSSSNKLRMHFSDGIRGKLYIRDSNGRERSVGDILISEGLAQGSVDGAGSGSWGKENSYKEKLFHSEEPNSLDQQWESLTFHPTPSQQPSWITNSTSTTDQLNMKRNALIGSLVSSKEQFLQGGSWYFGNVVDSKGDSNDISLNNVPLPPSPEMFARSKESDNLETFNLKRADSGPVEALRDARPHLASPNEFLSHSKGQVSGISSVPRAKVPSKYQPPHVRNARAKTSNTATMDSEPKLDKYSSLPQSNSNSLLQQHDQQHPSFSNFAFSPKIGWSNIAVQFQTKQAIEDQSLNSQPLQKQTLQSQQPEFLKQQPLHENTRDKTIKAELDWKIWKFQRNVKKVFDRMIEDSTKDYSHDFEKIIADSRLSQDFQGISELSVILQFLLHKVMDGNKYGSVAVSVCTMFRDMCIPEFGDFLNKEVTQCQDDLMEQYGATDCLERCKRFSSFLGKLYLEVLGDNDSSGRKFSLDGLIASSLHNWLSFDQADSELIHKLNAACLKSFLMVTGPTIDLTEGNEISRYFGTIRDLVLSQELAVPVKSTLLDILLLRASGWKAEEDSVEQETGSEFTEGEVFIEEDMTEEQQPEGTEENDEDEEWDPYSKVKSMLKNLKLQDLLPKFLDNCIRDSLLTAEWEALKRTLQGAGFPPGVILEIRMYLDKGLLEKGKEKASKPNSEKAPTTTANHTHEPKRASKSPSPTKSIEKNVAIRKLNQELQQLMISGTQDTAGGPRRVSPTRQISPPKEQPSHDGTPYSRGGPRKFVSRAERRHSAEHFQEDSDDTIADPLSDMSERMAPIPAASIEPPNISTSVATSPESPEPIKSVGTMSYSAVLKNLTSETTKPKNAPAGGKPPNQSKTFSRPRPGFTPLPTHGGDTEMRMTVLSTKSKTKQTAAASGAPRNNPTRADISKNWRNDEQSTQSSTQHQQQQHRANNSAQSGQAVKWQRSDESSQPKAYRNAPIRESGQGRDTPTKHTDYSSSDDSSEPPTAPVQPYRVFGPGGLKACVICGSKDHLRCNDRSKLFFD